MNDFGSKIYAAAQKAQGGAGVALAQMAGRAKPRRRP